MLKMLEERKNDFNAFSFINELSEASKWLGFLEATINNYQFDGILIPLLHKKEAISSMYIEGTQTTISDVYEDEISSQPNSDKTFKEANNHIKAIIFGSEYLQRNAFSHSFIQKIHCYVLNDIVTPSKIKSLGKYKTKNNKIVNSTGTTVFLPPSYTETKKYMNELIEYMNNFNDGINPLVKAAIIHSQFESIHPFEDGNGRVGRILISLYLYKAKVINFPFFYLSEAISQDKSVYYNMLTDSRKSSYNEWIKYFLRKCTVQAKNLTNYINSLNELYAKTKVKTKNCVSSPKYDQILECMFTQPILTSTYLSQRIGVSVGQAKRYLDTLENNSILHGNDKKRNKAYYFTELLDLVRRT